MTLIQRSRQFSTRIARPFQAQSSSACTTTRRCPRVSPLVFTAVRQSRNTGAPTITNRPVSWRAAATRQFSASTTVAVEKMTFETTPLGRNGADLLDGLDVYSVPNSKDGHPLSVYGIESENPTSIDQNPKLRPILLLHGRTWSSVPVYHLLGGPNNAQTGAESRSLMEALLEEGLQPYAMDFRGFGGTHADETGAVEPMRCVSDMESVMEWIAERHGMNNIDHMKKLTLLGWSQGALVAQMGAQQTNPPFGQLVLYGSIYDPLVRYPREPLYTVNRPNVTSVDNTFDAAIEDFTLEGTIPPEPAKLFAEAALISDPVKAVWNNLYQFNNCDPARVHVPTLVVAGDQDPYAPLHVQQELFLNLGRGCDRTWSILSNCDHAVHLLEGRKRLIKLISSFTKNGKQGEQGMTY